MFIRTMININPIYLQELREKNWKAMDAVSAAEKQHKVELGKAVQSVKVNKIVVLFVDLVQGMRRESSWSFKAQF